MSSIHCVVDKQLEEFQINPSSGLGAKSTMNGDVPTEDASNGHAGQNGVDLNGDYSKPGGFYSIGANPPPAWSNCKYLYLLTTQ